MQNWKSSNKFPLIYLGSWVHILRSKSFNYILLRSFTYMYSYFLQSYSIKMSSTKNRVKQNVTKYDFSFWGRVRSSSYSKCLIVINLWLRYHKISGFYSFCEWVLVRRVSRVCLNVMVPLALSFCAT